LITNRDQKQPQLTFNSVHLTNPLLAKQNQQLFDKASQQLLGHTTNKDLSNLIRSLTEEDEPTATSGPENTDFYLKISLNGHEFSTLANHTASADSKFIHELGAGVKDATVQLTLCHATSAIATTSITTANQQQQQQQQQQSSQQQLDKNCIPMLILAKEPHFSNLFQLVSLTSLFKTSLSNESASSALKRKCLNLSCKLWKIIVLIPTDKTYLDVVRNDPQLHLTRLIVHLTSNNEQIHNNNDLFNVFSPMSLTATPYQLLYYLQIIEIVLRQRQIVAPVADNETDSLVKELYKMLNLLVGYLVEKRRPTADLDHVLTRGQNIASSLTLDVLLECVLIVLRLLCNYLFEPRHHQSSTINSLKHGLAELSVVTTADHGQSDHEVVEVAAAAGGETPPKRQKRVHSTNATNTTTSFYTNPRVSPYHSSFLARLVHVPTLKPDLFKSMLDTNNDSSGFISVMLNVQCLAAVTNNSVSFYNNSSSQLTTTSIELLFNSMQLLTSCIFNYSCGSGSSGFDSAEVAGLRVNWLKCLLLIEHYKLSSPSGTSTVTSGDVDVSGAFRRECCAWLYRMCVLDEEARDWQQQSCGGRIKAVVVNEMLDNLSLAIRTIPVSVSDNI
jgi:hypothetical protein